MISAADGQDGMDYNLKNLSNFIKLFAREKSIKHCFGSFPI